ncbi:nitroreductase family protein [Heyndrickxia acidicola]|jgi:nitroreductase|uniref:Nitroreductase family protein n=1 Tax=Heyndrickxia acidicola TaxID=209389 RepID=A0ABU6MFL0_9BACI|nr:nitroreductase family protein [Heyndrickxia acidicola]MED1202468.1 nitroreductase family protein [Heyndrickxia acidicola]
MSSKTLSKEEYLTKAKDLLSGNQKPLQLESADFFLVAKERRSVRSYDPTFQMPDEDILEILETAIQAPSSSNLQPWRFLVIKDQELKQELLPIANNQQQVVEASAVIAVLSDIEGYKNADKIYGKLAEEGMMDKDLKDAYVNSIIKGYGSFSPEKALQVAMIDGGLVSMQIMLAAKAMGYDTVAMGGYDEGKFVEAFHVPANFKPVMLIALGKGEKAGRVKNRMPLEDVLTWNKY